MLVLILMLLVGGILVYISKFNFMLVAVNLGWWTFSNVPLFYVIIVSVLFGLVTSFLFNSVQEVANSFRLRGKDKEIKRNMDDVLELAKRVHQLELENERLKNGETSEPTDTNSL